MKLKNILLTSVLTATAVICSGNQQASAVVLDFYDISLGGNGSFIPQEYGDTENLDVSYRTIQDSENNLTVPFIVFDDDPTGGRYTLRFVAIPYGGVGEISLTPSEGYQVTLNSFLLGATNKNSQVRIYNNSDLQELLYDSGLILVSSTSAVSFNFNQLTSRSGLQIQWGIENGSSDTYHVAIDNINYEVTAIPEPLTILGSLAAIGVGVFLKREYDRKLKLAEVSS